MSEFTRKLALSATLLAISLGSSALGEYTDNFRQVNTRGCLTELEGTHQTECLQEAQEDKTDTAVFRFVSGFTALGGLGFLLSAAGAGSKLTRREDEAYELSQAQQASPEA